MIRSLSLALLFAWLGTSLYASSLLQAQTSREPTYNRDIAPIVDTRCAVCHHANGPAPFSLTSYADVKRHAAQIVAVTAAHVMPPWLPEPGYGDFLDERKLSDPEIAKFSDWLAAGAKEGPPSTQPPPAQFSEEWHLGKPDLIVKAPQPYVLLPNGDTESWPRFVLPVHVEGVHYVKGIEIHPGNPSIVHHCFIVTDRTGTIHIANGEVYQMGSTGMENKLSGAEAELDSRFLTWRPGTPPYFEPDGASWRLDNNTDLTLTEHLLASGKAELVQPEVGFYFTDQPPSKYTLILRLEHDQGIDIPPGDKRYEISDDLTLPVDVQLLSVLPHAHYLCREMQAFATLPDGSRRWLFWIKRWNFDWQGVFRYRQPMSLPKGTVLSMRYFYDNSTDNPRNPNSPPKRVIGGPKSTDEMADLWLEVMPAHREDLFALEIAMMQRKIEKYPGAVDGYADLGSALHAQGRNSEALEPLLRAASIRPDDAQVQNNLGTVLGSLGKFDDAVPHFLEALESRPDYFVACMNLGAALRLNGKLDQARIYYERAIELKPNQAAPHDKLGVVYAQQGNLPEAARQFQDALRLDPRDRFAQDNLARLQSLPGVAQ
jgi:Flp pilus assembly protein TadD/mono/diheme cytochrome c family protein